MRSGTYQSLSSSEAKAGARPIATPDRAKENAPEAGIRGVRSGSAFQGGQPPERVKRIRVEKVPPSTGWPSTVFGFIRKKREIFSAASAKPKFGGSSSEAEQLVSVPLEVTVQVIVTTPPLPSSMARCG